MSGGVRRTWTRKQCSHWQSEESGEICSTDPVASKDTPEGLGGETLPVWVQQPQRARPVWAGVRQTPFHVPLTGQRGRTMKRWARVLLPHRGGVWRKRHGDNQHFDICLKEESQGPEVKQTTHLRLKTNKPNLLFWPSSLFSQASGPERGA